MHKTGNIDYMIGGYLGKVMIHGITIINNYYLDNYMQSRNSQQDMAL